eukprot:SAG22_NODE_567_length_9042_cov_5.458459_3_plen_40_part_01
MDPKANGYNCDLYKHMREAGEDKASKTLWRRSSEGHHDEQ